MNDSGLILNNLTGGYGNRDVVTDVSAMAHRGEVMLLVGRNGSGKSTVLRGIMGLLPSLRGGVFWEGALLRHPPHTMRQKGIVLIPQRRPVFFERTVQDNLLLAEAGGGKFGTGVSVATIFEKYPLLAQRRNQRAGTLSGGERQLLALACAWMATPGLLLADEPAAGLSPAASEMVFNQIRTIADIDKACVLLVEHDVKSALRIADRVIGLNGGRVVVDCSALEFDEEKQRKVFVE
jgi:branched-chain amino acid transport system ATP-binding protein